jgi:hypothetical protein
MISISYPWNNVGIGNHFFIYTYLRLLAEKLNYKLEPTPVRINEHNNIKHSEYIFLSINGLNYSNNESYHIDDGFAISMEHIDKAVKFLTNKNLHILSNGYYQQCSYWSGYENYVKSFFSHLVSHNKKENTEIAIHLRSSNKDNRYKISPNYYLDCLNKIDFKNIHIFGDDYSRHKDTLEALEKFHPKIYSLNYIDTMKEISEFDKIILSQGSSSFWFGFLSNASSVFVPVTDFPLIAIPKDESIPETRPEQSFKYFGGIDYYIKDNKYIYIDLRTL